LWLEERGNNPGGRHAYYRSVRAFLNFFEEEVEPENWRNPISKVAGPKVSGAPLKPASVGEVSKLLETCDRSTFYGSRDKAIFLVLLDSGIRAGELLGIDLADLNQIDGSIQIRNGKGGKVRLVLIGKKARKAVRFWLRKRPRHPGPLFTKKNGEKLEYEGLRAMLERRSATAVISGVTLHDFRRAFCLAQLQAGVPETTIARLMGHANTQLIAVYAQQTTRHLREVFHSVVDMEL
jgi:integrase